MNLEQFDAILYFDGSEIDVFEGGVDPRNYNSKLPSGSDKPINGMYMNYIDPKLYASWSFGNQLKRDVQSLGSNYSCEVADFGQEIVVRVTHSDTVTGRSASKTFLVIFTNTTGSIEGRPVLEYNDSTFSYMKLKSTSLSKSLKKCSLGIRSSIVPINIFCWLPLSFFSI